MKIGSLSVNKRFGVLLSTLNVLITQFLINQIEHIYVENCSADQQKRLAIVLELTSQIRTNILCIDEPTSGLNSNTAEVVGFVNFIYFFIF